MSGGSGDADLYVRFGSAPTTSSYDCRPYLNGNNETCSISNIQEGTYFVMIRGYQAYSGVSLTGTYQGGSGNQNQNPSAFIANGPYSALEGATITMSSAGSADPDGSISTYAWNFGDGNTSSQANPSHAFVNAGTYNVTLTVTDNDGATDSAATTATITSPVNQLPSSVIANGPFNATVGSTIGMSSSGSNDPDGSISSYTWNFGDGSTSNQANSTHSYAAAGNYTVTLTVTDNEGASDSATTTAFITEAPNNAPTGVIANGPFSAEEGESISFSSNGSSDSEGSINAYSWNFGDGSTSSSANPSHAYASEGTYTVTLTVTDNDGATDTVTSSASITASNTGGGGGDLNEGDLSGSTNSTQNFSLDVPAGASNLVFAISGGSGDADLYVRFGSAPTTSSYDCRPYLNGNNETCNFASPQTGTYFVMVRAYSAYSGLSLTGSYEGGSSGGNNTPPSAVIANGPFSSVTGAALQMSSAGSTDSDGSISSYQWDFGDGNSSAGVNPSHSYSAPGTYSVTLTVTDNDGASDSATTTANITAAGSGFSVSSHFYDKGTFDFNYTDYETAFSDNFTDNDVEIHSYIVINFNENVRASTINENNIQVKTFEYAGRCRKQSEPDLGYF